LDNIDAAIHVFDPDLRLEDIKPRPVPPRHQAFKGEISRIVFTTLRNAKVTSRRVRVQSVFELRLRHHLKRAEQAEFRQAGMKP
jgi:hypothetical protein